MYIFKENFKTTIQILGTIFLKAVDDLWNNHLSNAKVLNGMINGFIMREKSKTKAGMATSKKQSNCFEIKELTDEDDLEHHSVKRSFNLSHRVDVTSI